MISAVFLRVLLVIVAVAGIGCGSGPPPPQQPQPSSNGCFDGSNDAGIVGCWYAYGDCTADQCSTVTAPVPGQPFPGMNGLMCTEGTAAKAVGTAGSAIRGTGIGFDLNNPGAADGGVGEKLPWDATAHGITGFVFQIDTPPVGGNMRVEFPTSAEIGTTDVNAAYWGGATANLSPINSGRTYSFHWADVGGPMDLTSPPPFDKTKILSMQFHVVSNDVAPIPFSYCISNIRALKD
jgi:hypothetical protein